MVIRIRGDWASGGREEIKRTPHRNMLTGSFKKMPKCWREEEMKKGLMSPVKKSAGERKLLIISISIPSLFLRPLHQNGKESERKPFPSLLCCKKRK